MADTAHKQGCDALGGYGNGVGACSCGADTQPLTPTDAEIIALLRPLYASDEAASMGAADDLRTARAILAKWGVQPVVRRAPTAAFDDPRVQAVYEILCDDTDWPPKETPQQHWEGWIARRIVERLFQDPVAREPLTDEQIELLMRSIGTTYADDNDERMKNHAGWQRMNHRQIVRAIEAAHGITGGQHGTDT